MFLKSKNNAESSYTSKKQLMLILLFLQIENGLSGTVGFNHKGNKQDLSSFQSTDAGIKSKGNDDFVLESLSSSPSAIFETNSPTLTKNDERIKDAWWSNDKIIPIDHEIKIEEKLNINPVGLKSSEGEENYTQDEERSQTEQSKLSEVRILPPKDFLDRMTHEQGKQNLESTTVKKISLSSKEFDAVKSAKSIGNLQIKSGGLQDPLTKNGIQLLKKLGLKDVLIGSEQQNVPSFSQLFGKGQRKQARLDLPGSRRKDFPSLTSIPITDFSCIDGPDDFTPRPAGFYADSETRCQVYHYCHFDGRQDSFLCPRGTVFNQAVFVCDWWYNVDCDVAQSLYLLNNNLYKASRSESPRAIQTSSGNDALIDELKSILNSAQKDQTDFFDFDDINNSGISNKRKAALRKKQQEGRSSTTKRAPEHFDENFVLDDETEEPLTLKPGFHSSRGNGNFQQFQLQQLQQIKDFVGQNSRKRKTQKKPYKTQLEVPLMSYKPAVQKATRPVNIINPGEGSFYDPEQQIIVSFHKAPNGGGISSLSTGTRANQDGSTPNESGSGKDTLQRIKEIIENEQDRFKYTSKPQSEEGSDQGYENEQTSEYDDEESYEDENLSNNVKKENIQYELQEDSGESDYYYNDSKGNNQIYDQTDESKDPLPPVVSFQTRPQNMELEVQSIVSNLDDDDLGDRRVSVAALKAAKSRLAESASAISPPKWEIQEVDNIYDAEVLPDPDEITSYDDYSHENSFQKGLDLSPLQKPFSKKMNSTAGRGKIGKDGLSNEEIQNIVATRDDMPPSGMFLSQDQWMIDEIKEPSPPFSTLKPNEEEKNDEKPHVQTNSIGFDTLLSSMKAFNNSLQTKSGNIWTEMSKKGNTKKQESNGNTVKRSSLTEFNLNGKQSSILMQPTQNIEPLSVVSAPNLQQLQRQIIQLNEKIQRLPQGSVVDTSFKPSPLLSATSGSGLDLFSTTQNTNNVNLPSAASQNLLQQQLTKQQLLILKLHQQQEQQNRQFQQSVGINAQLQGSSSPMTSFPNNNRFLDQQRWAGRRKDEDLETHPGSFESKNDDDDDFALLEKSSALDDRFEVIGDKCYIIVSGIPHQVGEAIACPDNSLLFDESFTTSSEMVTIKTFPTQEPLLQPGATGPLNKTLTPSPPPINPNPPKTVSGQKLPHLKTPLAPHSESNKGQKSKLDGIWDGLSHLAKTIGLSN